MAVLLNKAYMGLNQGATVALATNIENALIAQGLASSVAGKATITPGNITYNGWTGSVAVPAGASSVTITSPYFDRNTKLLANIGQAAADGTLTSIVRIVAADAVAGAAGGTVTIYGNANATANTIIDWVIAAYPGLTIYNP